MRGVVFLGERKVELRSFPDPTPGPGEVVLEMKASGMCGSDLKFYRSPPGAAQAALGLGTFSEPFIGGHEPCGVVIAVGSNVDVKMARIGQRVMVHHYQGCTQCNHCRSGWQQLCQEVPVKVYGNNAHGGHAQYLKVPANTLVRVQMTDGVDSKINHIGEIFHATLDAPIVVELGWRSTVRQQSCCSR